MTGSGDYFVHPQGICESTNIGSRTRVWAFSHVLPGAVLGADVNVNDHVFIENDVVIGDRVTLKSGVQVWDGIQLGDDVFIGPNATFTNDPFPRSKQYPESFARTVIEDGASVGGGAVILPGIRIGRRAMIGAGAVVTKDVPPYAIVVGNPARIVGYADTPEPTSTNDAVPYRNIGPAEGITQLRTVSDIRGALLPIDIPGDLPFTPQRVFFVHGVPSKEVRGEHAHRRCEQFLVCLTGSVSCIVDDGTSRREFVLSDPSMGLHMPPMTWGTQYRYSADAVLCVFASQPYDDSDYIRDYEEFLATVRSE
ncbi:WxcM-like domain-containing protein [Microbacterium hominis]|uniref:Isomerase n=1 Tax=Microbacterium hominis TaxID=162426 RepID=A0A0B4D5V9_9MICO|nr:WxcM-like domain-containing protein [Microbacterium hominis]KIC59570.1 isomerase [Microbacterium hominis]